MKSELKRFYQRAAGMLLMMLLTTATGLADSPWGHPGRGTAADPYQIWTEKQWVFFVNMVSAENDNYGDKYYKMMADIAVSSTIYSQAISVGGTWGSPFRGHFDGGSHTLTFNCIGGVNALSTAPFGYISGATISNLRVAGQVSDNQYGAGIANYVVGNSTISDCTVSSTIEGTHSHSGNHGGLVGEVKSWVTLTITNCTFCGSFTGQVTLYCGGFVGNNFGTVTITDCLFAPTQVDINSNYLYSFSYDWNDSSTLTRAYRTYENVYSFFNQGTRVYVEPADGQIYKRLTLADGNNYYLPGTGSTGAAASYYLHEGSATITYGATFDGEALTEGTDYDAVITNSSNQTVGTTITTTGTYTLTVTLKGNYVGSITTTFEVKTALQGNGTADKPYIIDGTPAWDIFAKTVNGAENYTQSSFANQYVMLTNDIGNVTVAAGTSDHPFCGTFIGGGYTMGLNLRNGKVEGLAPFSHISGATIKDLTVTGSVFGRTHSAGLVGFANGTNTIDGCKVNVRVEVEGVNGVSQHIGGVVGHGKSSTLTIKNTSFGGLLVNRGDYAGGLMGWCDAGCKLTIDNCLTTGTCETEGDKVFHPIAIRNENAAVTATNHGAYYTSQPTQTESARIIMRGTRVYADQPGNEMYQQQVLTDGNTYYVPVTISGLETVYAYTGSAINPTYSVTVGDGTTLTEGTDYSVTRSNATIRDAGAYAITFTGKNGYEGAKTCYFIVGDPTPATPEGLSVDADIDYPEAGHFYYNMPAGNPVSNTLTFSNSDVTTFKVYDGGGKNGNIPLKITSSSLTITAPAGCTISVEGDVKLYDNDWKNYVSVYNVSGDGETELTKVQGYNTLGPVTSTSNTLRIYYYQSGPGEVLFGNKPGYDLTVTINDANKKYAVNVVTPTNGSLSTSPTKAAPGSTVTITATPAEGYLNGEFTVLDYSQQPVAVSNGQFVMPSSPVIVATTFRQIDPADFSVNGDGTYTIKTAKGWDAFCDALQENATYNRFSGKTVKLGKDIEVTRMAGSSKHDFCGTFDGGEYTLTVNYGTAGAPASVQNVAPFSYVSNVGSETAAIKNLHVAGDIYTQAKYAAGIVGQHWGTLNIENCRSSIVIYSTTVGDGTHGGFEGASNGTLNITGCVFDGKLLTTATNSTTLCGGFVGYGTCTITNSLYAPAGLADGETEITNGSCTFVRNATPGTNCYYTRTLGTEQGKAARNIEAGTDVTISGISPVGSPVEDGTYNVSGITAYAKGITRTAGQATTFYYGLDDEVSLTLGFTGTVPSGYQYGFSVTGGTLAGNDTDGYTLTMPDEDVTVSAVFTKLPVITSYVDADGTLHENIEAIPLDNTMTTLAAGTYVVNSNVTFTSTLTLNGDITLILGDGCTMNVGTSESRINGKGIDASGIGNVLTIYGQSAGSGKLNVYTIDVGIRVYDAYVQHGGIVNIESPQNCIEAQGEYDYANYCFVSGSVTVDGGKLTVTSSGNTSGIFTAWDIAITGGEVSAEGKYGIFTYGNITLGWTNPTDRIYVSRYYATTQYLGGTISIASGQKLTDGTNIYTDATESATLKALTNTTLYPYIENLSLAANPHDGNYWTTFYCGHTGYKIDDTENAWAYTAEYDDTNSQLTLHKLGKVIPKQTAVILVGSDNEISMTASTAEAENTVGNDLHGEDVRTLKSTLGTGTFYVMGKVNDVFGFYQYTAQYMPARKAYLLISGSGAPGLKMVFDDGETSGLSEMRNEKGEMSSQRHTLTNGQRNAAWYSLDGVKLSSKPTQKGVYIHGNKKIVIK